MDVQNESMCDPFKRSPDDVLQLINHAKLEPSDIIPLTQSLVFPEDYETCENITLMEANSEILDTLKTGQRLVIRGDPEEFSVLCTDSKTFEIREAETSNSCLLVPDLKILKDSANEDLVVLPKEVLSIHYKYLELRPCQPRLGKLLNVLTERSYKDTSCSDFGYTWDELCNLIQASEKELKNGLKKYKAFYYKERWCLLDFDYHFSLLSSMLNLIDSNSLSIYALDRDEILDTLSSLEPRSLLNQCFDYFFSPVEVETTDKQLYKINEVDVNKFCSEILLKSSGKFNLEEFLSIWQQSVPEGLTTHLSQLRGVALVNEDCSPAVIWYFPVSGIPLDVSQAFAFLFQTKPKWKQEEIQPYLEEFLSPKQSVTVLLSKYARASTVNGVRYFTAKHCG